MFSLRFNHRQVTHTLAAGETFLAPRTQGFRDTPAAELQTLVEEIRAGRPWREAVGARYAATNPWLHRIITDPRRTAFFGPVLPAGDGPVLDLGSGWGQIARPLAGSRPVVALEPVAERLAFIEAAARQDGVAARLTCLGADYFDVGFADRFAVICAIGVLEWAGTFQGASDPQERQREFLARARRDLAPGGSLVLGIENRIGLKYLLGCPDDHLGVPGIGCLPAAEARARWREKHGRELHCFTYSLGELDALLRGSGFSRIEFFGAFPDYKLPDKIVPLGDDGRELNAWLQSGPLPAEHNGHDGSALDARFLEDLAAHYRSLAAEGIARHFAPSFFVRAA